ncbi:MULTISPECIES: NUDIX domain-containing protein [unclassified Exiguobacterium]|uniref:NUDIX domain-containing protein n=1 Tax=unclassified Exiguobacterium TaxID=2644629 RepID=UPI001BEC9530|nr:MULTISPECIES: NUDIX domain-containing protein [unclassified Exiguobacterium]
MDINFKFEKQRFNHRAAAVIVKEGCLLIHRNIRDAFWALPGGRIQLMESGETAVVREIKEELGLEAQVKRFLCVHEISLHMKTSLFMKSVFITKSSC